ncbi:Crp/Fnr family transcriptional regulator [Chryseolinea sp. T2]|uniref:Crp/Fnr family transcriptional regulator n=1 Tax=Chryseolinea sp. T2 TaxID=3129255 RepID=UPI0030775ED8
MISSFALALRQLCDLPAEEEAKVNAIAFSETIKRGEYFIREGAIPTRFGFVVRGLFRYYYLDTKGTEFTKGFFPENNFLTSYTAMKAHRPSYFAIEAMEDSDVVAIDYHHWHSLYAGHPCWQRFLLALLEKGYAKKESRERELLVFNAEERYLLFREQFPNLEARIKQHMVASYLGITPVALSRIRKTLSMTHT